MKNVVVVFSLLFASLVLSSCKNETPNPGIDDIITFRVNNFHTGIFTGKGVKHPFGFNWLFKTGGPIRSTPAYFDSTVFFGSSDGNFYAVDFSTGKEKWEFETKGSVQSSASISGNKIFFSSRDGNLYGLNINSGKEVWKSSLGKDIPYSWGFDYYISSPAIENNNVYIGSGDGYFYSINADNGKVQWKFNCNSRVRSTAAISSDCVLFGDLDGNFYSLTKDEGKLKWKFEVEGKKYKNEDFGFDRRSILCSAALTGDKVIFGSRDGNLYALNLADGKELWKYSHGTSWIITSPAIYNGVVYAGSSDARFLQAVDLETGKELWRTNTKQAVWSSPAVAGNEIYFGDMSGTLYSLNLKSGKQNWAFNLMKGFILVSPVIVNNNVLIGGDDGNLYCVADNPNLNSEVEVKRVVYWEDNKAYKWFQNGIDERIKDYFASFGYEVLDKNSLAKFFEEQIITKTRSVAVFASNRVPFTVFNDSTKNYLIKDYLVSGGKVVFLSANPLALVLDNKSGRLTGIDFQIPSKLFGVDYHGEVTDAMKGWFYSKVTPEGEKWGLTSWWVGIASVDKNQVTKVLAEDENGNAAAWVKNYGGSEGTGLVQLWVGRSSLPDLSPIKLAVEYGL